MRYYTGPMGIKRFQGGSLRLHGGKFDFFGFLKTVGKLFQGGIDKIAPLTSKMVGPIASALTGIKNIPNPSDLGMDASSLASLKDIGSQILDKNSGNKVVSSLKSLMRGKGLSLHA